MNALRRVLFFETLNNDGLVNDVALHEGYIREDPIRITAKGKKYISEMIAPNCVIPGCKDGMQITCFCKMHYARYRRGARGEHLLEVKEELSKELWELIEQVCRGSNPFGIEFLTGSEEFMEIVAEGLEKDVIKYVGTDLIQITPKAFEMLD